MRTPAPAPALVATLLTALLGLLSSEIASAKNLVPKRAGTYERTLETEDLALRFGIEVPKGVAKKNAGPRPLVLALHFGFDGSRPFPKYYGKAFMERVISPGLEDLGAFIVAPDSHGHPWARSPMVEPVLELLDALVADPRIDGDRVIVMGYSMGGTGTWFFAAEHGDRFAAAVPMAGRFRAEWVQQSAGLPVHALYSHDDELISADQVRPVFESEQRQTLRLTAIRGVTHYQSPLYGQALEAIIVPWLREVLAAPEKRADTRRTP